MYTKPRLKCADLGKAARDVQHVSEQGPHDRRRNKASERRGVPRGEVCAERGQRHAPGRQLGHHHNLPSSAEGEPVQLNRGHHRRRAGQGTQTGNNRRQGIQGHNKRSGDKRDARVGHGHERGPPDQDPRRREEDQVYRDGDQPVPTHHLQEHQEGAPRSQRTGVSEGPASVELVNDPLRRSGELGRLSPQLTGGCDGRRGQRGLRRERFRLHGRHNNPSLHPNNKNNYNDHDDKV
ncbi:hypothetical protein Ocin01_12745 [Orchesella cincta]|uniref:Uncharacterized protein n=1 Tax=Orchesella cincta TaxID=48709 RepID=A0A1D2MLY9_ORCCI|nr:hypothetical protein Ocin01_12745 [Orchesella cincta]